MTSTRLGFALILCTTATARADTPPTPDRDREIALALEPWPLFVVDEKTPHALIIVPVASGPGHAHAAP